MLLQYFKEEAYDRLIGSISDNLDWYCNDMVTIDDIGLDSESYEISLLDLPGFSLVPSPKGASNDEKNLNDIINIKSVYGNWKELTPLQARNKYLWTYYCHCNSACRTYIRARWMDGDFSESQVRDRFFVTESKRNLVRENALSSLWWKGYLTYDADNANNHFWLTEVLGTTTNLADFLDTFNSFNPTRAKGVIKAIAEVLDELGLDQLKNQTFRDLNRYLNRYAAVMPLDYLSEEEMKELVKAEFRRLCIAETQ